MRNNSKKVLFVTESLTRGGMETVLVNISNALVKHGYDITILCYDPRDDLKPELNRDIHYIFKPRRRFKLMNKIPFIRRFYNYRKAAWEHRVSATKLYRYYVGKAKYDIEIGFYRGPSIKIISGSTNKSSVKLAWVHTDFSLCNINTIIGWFNSLNEVKSAYKKMNKVVCVSEQARQSFLNTIGYNVKTTAIYNLIPIKKIQKLSKENCSVKRTKFTIVSVGRLTPDKKQERLLYSANILKKEGYDFDVWILGSGEMGKKLKQYKKNNKLENVHFWGMQDNPYKYLKQADLFVLTSKREGFAIVIPEAMACGLPVLSTACTGPTEILNNGEYGILVDNNSNGVYTGLKKALDNPEILKHYREKSEERYMDFDESVIIQEITDLF